MLLTESEGCTEITTCSLWTFNIFALLASKMRGLLKKESQYVPVTLPFLFKVLKYVTIHYRYLHTVICTLPNLTLLLSV